MMYSIFQKAKTYLFLLLLSALINTAYANNAASASTLASDLHNLLSEAEAVNMQLAGITLTDNNLCSELSSAHQSAEALINSIEIINANLTTPLSVDNDSMQVLDDISAVIVVMAANSTGLSLDLTALGSTANMSTISNGLSAMLRLSDDIGTMANRILEMADKILLMADNIGTMADRIILTQQIQSENLALTQASILATQQNSLALVSVINTSTYNADFNAQIWTGNILAADMSTTWLTQFNMSTAWASLATDVESLLAQITTTHEMISAAAATNTIYLDVDSYTALADMSIMVNAISVAMEGLALATEGLSPITRDITLSDSMNSILQLSTDIGVMANRILEMADLILAMADNIGLTSDQIIATQQLQTTNYAATLASVETTQEIAISIIAVNSL